MITQTFICLCSILALALCWDAYAVWKWPGKDYTVSAGIYYFDHHEPIISGIMGAFVLYQYMMGDMLSTLLGLALFIHLNWNA